MSQTWEDTMVDWLNTAAFHAFGAPTSRAEVIGFVTGALCVWLVARQNVLNWPIGIANNLVWILLFATAGLYADSALQVVYIALAVAGWWLWLNGGAHRTELPVSGTTAREWGALIGVGVAATAALTLVLAHLTDSTVPFLDAVTTVLSLLATWGQANKRWESWLLWMAADVIYVPLYLHKGLTLTALLYTVFFALCVLGLRNWRADVRAAAPAAAVAA